jgi:hypothetical protein
MTRRDRSADLAEPEAVHTVPATGSPPRTNGEVCKLLV